MSQKVALITGSNGAIGKEISRLLIQSLLKQGTPPKTDGLKLILVCRSPDKVKQVQDYLAESFKNASPQAKSSFPTPDVLKLQFGDSPSQVTVQGEIADLSSYESVQHLVKQIKLKNPKLDILVNNAAVASQKKELTKDNIELQWAVNVMSYYWLTLGLQDVLNSADPQHPSNVVFVASNYAGGLDLSDVNFSRRRYSSNDAYRATKQANRLLARGFANHFSQAGLNVRVNACHPGVTTSAILQGLGMSQGFESAEQSAELPVFLATSSNLGTGEYYSKMKKIDCPFIKDSSSVSDLWSYCEQLTNTIRSASL